MSADHGHGGHESHGWGFERPKTGIMWMFGAFAAVFSFAGLFANILHDGGWGGWHHDDHGHH